eukprot:1362090-Amorphochlora_amoeboformis.AAC.3
MSAGRDLFGGNKFSEKVFNCGVNSFGGGRGGSWYNLTGSRGVLMGTVQATSAAIHTREIRGFH